MELSSPQDAAYKDLAENQLASLYKLAEQEKAAGNLKGCCRALQKVSETASQPSARANAQFDAASAYIDIKDWPTRNLCWKTFASATPSMPRKPMWRPSWPLAYGEQGGLWLPTKWSACSPQVPKTPIWRKT